jgi:hypothetical protein
MLLRGHKEINVGMKKEKIKLAHQWTMHRTQKTISCERILNWPKIKIHYSSFFYHF